MKKEIKNATILEKTVRRENGKILKRVQDDMGWFRCGLSGALAPEKNFSLLTFHFSPSHFSRKFGFTLAEGATHVVRQHNKRKFAFTLAEVLITLGIIGVVAAMTLPSLIQKYQEQVTVNKVKKFYSLMSQAIQCASVDNGMPDEWNLPPLSVKSLYNYLKPSLKIAKDCIQGSNDNCVPNYNFSFKSLNGNNYPVSHKSSYYGKLILADGSLFWFRTSNGGGCKDIDAGYNDVCALFLYDSNAAKAPNTLGKDIFSFVLRPYGLFPHNNDDCYKDSGGWGCARYILEHGNMDYPKTKQTN